MSLSGLVLVESFPRIVPFSRLSADHKKIRPFETHFHLPIPLKHWEQEPFSFFHVLDKMLRRFDFEHPHLRYILLSDGLVSLELGMAAKPLNKN